MRRGVRILAVLAVFGLMLGAAGQANAVLVLNGNSAGQVLFEGNVTYVVPGCPSCSGTVPGTIIGKTLSSLQTHLLTVQFNAGDLDFQINGNSGFRWSERINNNSGSTIVGLTVDLVQVNGLGGDFLVDSGWPSQAAITNGGAPTVTQLAGDQAVVSNLDRRVTFTFAAPVLSGSFVDIHIPIEHLFTNGNGMGRFNLNQTFIAQNGGAVPEPGTLLLMVSGLAGVGVLGRKRWFKNAER
jgi:hypothetical protein